MEKPASLRTALEKAYPAFKDHPEKLTMWVIDGSIAARKGTLGHTEHYRLCINIADMPTTDIVQVNLIIINWAETWQPELLGVGRTDPHGWEFEINLLDNKTADVAIVLKLSEELFIKTNDKNQVTQITHRKPPQQYNDLTWAGLPENMTNHTEAL